MTPLYSIIQVILYWLYWVSGVFPIAQTFNFDGNFLAMPLQSMDGARHVLSKGRLGLASRKLRSCSEDEAGRSDEVGQKKVVFDLQQPPNTHPKNRKEIVSQHSSRIWLKSIFWGTNSPSFIYLLYPDRWMHSHHQDGYESAGTAPKHSYWSHGPVESSLIYPSKMGGFSIQCGPPQWCLLV